MLDSLTASLQSGTNLTPEQISRAVGCLADAAVEAGAKADFLSALARKGETADEIAAFAAELRDRSLPIPGLDPLRLEGILDVCGTGGDRLGTFNISTTVAFVVSAGGVTVAKHGNRAITSKSGAADVLEALGVRIDLTPAEASEWLLHHRFAFLFAPRFHPAFQHIGPARKLCAERGQRTLFNFLGPLLNPARPDAQLLGVSHPRYCAPLAQVLQSLGVRRGMVVSGEVPGEPSSPPRFMDEWSVLGSTTVAEFYHDRAMAHSVMAAEEFLPRRAELADLEGGDRDANAAIVRSILEARERGPKRDAVLVNAGAAFFVAGKTRSILEGQALAGSIIDSGRAGAKLAEVIHASDNRS